MSEPVKPKDIQYGGNLRCRYCGRPPADVAPGFSFDANRECIEWSCPMGHRQFAGWRPDAG
jgi:hypothetical protein